jgi:hypothetical protein
MKSRHLEDSVFAAWALDPGHEVAIEHFEVCGECRREAVNFRRATGAMRDGLHRAAEARKLRGTLPLENQAQDAGPERAEWRVLPRLISVATLGVILVLVVLSPRAPTPAPQPAVNDAADNTLLIQIQRDLNRQAPEALAPAEMLFADATKSFAGSPNDNLNEGTEQ